MKAAVYLGPGKMELRDVPTPSCKEGDVLIRVFYCAVCGTDVRIFTYGQKNVVPPHIIGHEISGNVEQAGRQVAGISPGERVTLVTSVGCGRCKYCRKGYYNLCVETKAFGYFYPGGFAEFLLVPEEAVRQNAVLKLPGSITGEEASLVEPLSCCINGQEYLRIEPGETVVIFGAGPIGCMHAELAHAKGARTVIMIDPSDARLRLAKGFHAATLINSGSTDPGKKVMELTCGEGADIVITACPANAAQEQAVQIAAKRGRISFFGGLSKDNPYIRIDSNLIHYKELGVFGAFASHRRQYEEALALIAEKKVDINKFITHRYKLGEVVRAIETVKSGACLKAVVEVQDEIER